MENNIEKSFPFDAVEVNGKYDREYLADDFARYFRAFISSGTFMQESTNLQVLANGDMTVTMKKGKMMIDGYRYESMQDIIIPISPADGVLDRIDRIAITWSRGDRDIHYTVREGDFSYRPVPPECRRSAEYRDYVVADIYVAANRISITQSAITDQRLNRSVCGVATPFADFDTTMIFNQLQAFFQETVASANGTYDQFVKDLEKYLTDLEDSGDSQLREIVRLLTSFEASSEQQWNDWFDGIRNTLASVENGEMLEELLKLIKELYEIATEKDIDNIIAGTYVDDENLGGIFETATEEDIDAIIGDTYEDTGGDPVIPDMMTELVNSAFDV